MDNLQAKIAKLAARYSRQPELSTVSTATTTTAGSSSLSGKKKASKGKARAAAAGDSRPKVRIGYDYQAGQFTGLTIQDYRAWGRAFPGLNLTVQVARAAEWLRDVKPGTYKNLSRFLRNWLRKATQPPKRVPPPPGAEPILALFQPHRGRSGAGPVTPGDILRGLVPGSGTPAPRPSATRSDDE